MLYCSVLCPVSRHTLLYHNETHSNQHWFELCVDLPPPLRPLATYRATLGHKAR